MIIRKPYAFLIRNFKKIHIVLLILAGYIFYRTINVFLFVNEFMAKGVYDFYSNPVSEHITTGLMFSIILVIAGSLSILFLLLHKEKPWKSYLIPIVVYTVLLFVLMMIRTFFLGYSEMVDTANLRLSRDLLVILFLGQLPALWIFLMRFFGFDFKKFDFDVDLENLDLSEEDHEEVELSLNVDISVFKRLYNRFMRNLGYFYKEHKFICYCIIGFVGIFIITNLYTFIFVVNKTYKQGQLYNANGYTMQIVNSYFTDKDDTGKVISKDSNFVIVEFIVKNNQEDRVFDTDNVHLKSGLKTYSSTEATYQNEFSDLGTCYSKVKILKKGEETRFIIIYKVNRSFLSRKAVIYYQEKSGIFKLRKIKLKTKNISKLDKPVDLEIGDMFDVTIKNSDESLSFDSVKFLKSVTYRVNNCTTIRCDQSMKTYDAPKGYSILTMDFASDVFESTDMIKFLTKYGNITYKDKKGKSKTISIENAVKNRYFGKTVYIKVKDEVASSSDVIINITMRNKVYNYHLT